MKYFQKIIYVILYLIVLNDFAYTKSNINKKIERIVRKNYRWKLYDQNKKSCGLFDWVILSIPAEQSLELISNKVSFYYLINT